MSAPYIQRPQRSKDYRITLVRANRTAYDCRSEFPLASLYLRYKYGTAFDQTGVPPPIRAGCSARVLDGFGMGDTTALDSRLTEILIQPRLIEVPLIRPKRHSKSRLNRFSTTLN